MTPDQLLEAVRIAERQERAARGLPEDHVLDFSQFPFAFALNAVDQLDAVTRSAYPKHPELAFYRAMAALAKKDYGEANTMMEAFAAIEPASPKSAMRFGVRAPNISAELPAVHGDYPKDPALFLCCDEGYFRTHCVPLLASISANAPRTRVHLHLMDADVPFIASVLGKGPLRISITHEVTGGRGHEYYNAVRLIRFTEALEESDGPLLISDVDALVMGDLDPLFRTPASLAMRVRPGRLEPWNQFSACLVLGTKQSRDYFREVSRILRGAIAQPWWGVDQYALFAAWTALRPEISLLGPDMTSVTDDAPGLFWYTAGRAKKGMMEKTSKYAVAYRHFVARS